MSNFLKPKKEICWCIIVTGKGAKTRLDEDGYIPGFCFNSKAGFPPYLGPSFV